MRSRPTSSGGSCGSPASASIPMSLWKEIHGGNRVLAYDAQTGVVLLWARDVAVLVDASNCVNGWTQWVKERLCMVEAVGYLEHAPPDLHVPGLPEHFPLTEPKVDEALILRAIMVVARRDLEMDIWKEGAENNGSRKDRSRSYARFVLQ
ncbi:hypothetical protein K438DRAFT_1809639 [Mycena galopus ATCC 62051]|nr:hypothetical protein K438DRAFT_1809639 [Mycena galopus ATCC 62051]